MRSASIISDDECDLILISRDLYHRSVAKIVNQEYEEKKNFVEKCGLFRSVTSPVHAVVCLRLIPMTSPLHAIVCLCLILMTSPCRDWADKWKKSVALSVVRVRLSYDETLVRQGEEAENLFFVTSGELKLVADAEQHKQQFADVMKSASSVLLDDKFVRSALCDQ